MLVSQEFLKVNFGQLKSTLQQHIYKIYAAVYTTTHTGAYTLLSVYYMYPIYGVCTQYMV